MASNQLYAVNAAGQRIAVPGLTANDAGQMQSFGKDLPGTMMYNAQEQAVFNNGTKVNADNLASLGAAPPSFNATAAAVGVVGTAMFGGPIGAAAQFTASQLAPTSGANGFTSAYSAPSSGSNPNFDGNVAGNLYAQAAAAESYNRAATSGEVQSYPVASVGNGGSAYHAKGGAGSVESFSAMPVAQVGESGTRGGVGSTGYVASNGGSYAALAAPVEVKETTGGVPEITNVASLDQFPKAEHAKLAADPARVAAISSIPMVAKSAPAPQVQQVKHSPAPVYAKASYSESHSVSSLSQPAVAHTAQHKPSPVLAKPVAHVNAMQLPPAYEAHTAVAQADGYVQQAPVHKQHARTVQDVASMAPMPLPPRAHNAELIAQPMPTNVEQVALAKPSAPAHPIELNMMPATTRASEPGPTSEPTRVVNKLRDVAVFAAHARDAKSADEAPITSWLPGNNNQGLELARAAAPQMPEGISADAQVDEVSKHFENTIQNLTNCGASQDVVQSVVDNYRDYLRFKNSQGREQQVTSAPQVWHSLNA